MPESLNAKVNVPGKGKTKLQRQLTLEVIIDHIKKQTYLDEYTINGLIDIANRYPTQAFPAFKRNFNMMIERVRNKRRQELKGMPPEQKEESDDQIQEDI